MWYSAVKNNDIWKFEGKSMELEKKNHPKCDNPDLERQKMICTHSLFSEILSS